jgi:magnesium chelatase subunit I
MALTFPFSAIVGQDEMKRAILIAAVDPSIGGVLVFGDRGTGKSTAVRGLAALLPRMRAVAACRYGCDPKNLENLCEECQALRGKDAKTALKTHLIPVPVVDLPLGATEDRVVGALDLERALSQGVKAFEPGLLARAHRGFLYIDEVNLLEDHLVDLLIDVASSGENVVERDGLSVRHPARFVLVGSGNPEEGELRPQLLDRFGLSVEVKTPDELAPGSRWCAGARPSRPTRPASPRNGRRKTSAPASASSPGANTCSRSTCPRPRANAPPRCAWRWAPMACGAT